MANAHVLKWLGAAVGGAIAGGVLWLMANGMVRFNDVGWLAGRGDWWARWPAWSLAGAVVGVVGEFVKLRRAHDRTEALLHAAEFLGFEYFGAPSRERFAFAEELSIFRKWLSAENCLAGEIAGTPVEVLDLTYREKGSSDSPDRDYRQTVVLLPAGEGWPQFELQPRGAALQLLSTALGFEGIVLEPPSEMDRPAYEEFQRRYFLTGNLDALANMTTSDPYAFDPEHPESSPAQESLAAARLFSPEVVRYFAERPGYRLQGNAQCLAVWKHRRLVAPAALPAFVRQAQEIRAVLAKAAKAASGRQALLAPAAPRLATSDPLIASARVAGSLIGAFAGFFGGGILGGIAAGSLFFAFDAEGPGGFFSSFFLSAAVFFGGAFGGLVLGGWVGGKLLLPIMLALMRHRRERLAHANPDRRQGQPLTSNAQVSKGKKDLTIHLPPLGLWRAGGGFLFIFCMIWLAFTMLFSALFLPAAFRNEVQWNEGPETLSPWFACLFLLPFWAVGLGILAFLIHRGRRRATITIANGRLAVQEQTIFGPRDHEWALKEIEDIRVGTHSATSPPQWRLELQLQGESLVHLLGHRPPEELRWLAGEMRRAVGWEQEPVSPKSKPADVGR